MKVKLLPYGIALERYQKEMKHALPCEARVTDACFNGARGMNAALGDRCGYFAKVDIDGKRLCARHAGMITLSNAIKRGKTWAIIPYLTYPIGDRAAFYATELSWRSMRW